MWVSALSHSWVSNIISSNQSSQVRELANGNALIAWDNLRSAQQAVQHICGTSTYHMTAGVSPIWRWNLKGLQQKKSTLYEQLCTVIIHLFYSGYTTVLVEQHISVLLKSLCLDAYTFLTHILEVIALKQSAVLVGSHPIHISDLFPRFPD